MDLLTFLLIVNGAVAIAATLILLLCYFVVSDVDLLFTTNLHGLAGFVGGLLVAVKQLLPDSTILQVSQGKRRTHTLGSNISRSRIMSA